MQQEKWNIGGTHAEQEGDRNLRTLTSLEAVGIPDPEKDGRFFALGIHDLYECGSCGAMLREYDLPEHACQ